VAAAARPAPPGVKGQGFFSQHDRNVIQHGINQSATGTGKSAQRARFLFCPQLAPANRAGQKFQQIAIQHFNSGIFLLYNFFRTATQDLHHKLKQY
jgi:hypothetical protein